MPQQINEDANLFDVTHDATHDAIRLQGQSKRVWSVMTTGRDAGQWFTLGNIAYAILCRFSMQDSETGISARLRDFRRPKFGSHTVDRRRMRDGGGLFEYRLKQNPHALMFPLDGS